MPTCENVVMMTNLKLGKQKLGQQEMRQMIRLKRYFEAIGLKHKAVIMIASMAAVLRGTQISTTASMKFDISVPTRVVAFCIPYSALWLASNFALFRHKTNPDCLVIVI